MTDYPNISVASATWTSVAAATEAVIWQVHGGTVYLSTKAAPSGETGLRLEDGEVIQIASGKAVWYRGAGQAAWLSREAV